MADNLLYQYKSLDSDNTKCPNCGGTAQFNPKLQKVQCLYCKSVIDINDVSNVYEQPIEDLLLNAKPWNNTEVIKCTNCGAKEIISKGEIATECAYCGTTNVVKTDEIVGMKPKGVCPFEKTINQAETLAKKWASSKFFAVSKFKKNAVAKNMHGVYSPVFTFDCETTTRYNGILAKTETYYTYSNGKRISHTRTKHFPISGTYNKNFDDLLIQASDNIPQNTLKKLEPFPTHDAVKYNKKYLSGYLANTYTKNGYEYWQDSKTKMNDIIKSSILSKYFYTHVVRYEQNVVYSKTKYKYLLVPVYVGHYTFKQKVYNFFINGNTGKVVGNYPVSGWKIFFLILGILVVIGGIIALVNILSALGILVSN